LDGRFYKSIVESVRMVNVNKKDFVEIEYSGYSNGELFDSNIEEEVKKLNPEGKGEKTIIAVGEKMVVVGLDNDLEGKDVGKEYSVTVSPKDGFGDRNREMIKTVPLKAFTEHKIDPRPGMSFNIDNQLVRVIAVSGARVTADFNNPMAGKELEYKYRIIRKVEDEKEKVEGLFKNLFRMVPEFKVEKDKVVVKGQKGMQVFVEAFNKKFEEILGKGLSFEEVKPTESKKDGMDLKVDEKGVKIEQSKGKDMSEEEMLDALQGKK
jgi:FKBP-type peptidyl-prolyl cis-trans isomerase SlyD